MPADYKLRLGDGTILAVDEAGLRTWLIDGKAMVQPAGSRRWMPLREVLAQVQAQAAAEARRESMPRTAPQPEPAPAPPPPLVTPPVATPAPKPPPPAPAEPPAPAPPEPPPFFVPPTPMPPAAAATPGPPVASPRPAVAARPPVAAAPPSAKMAPRPTPPPPKPPPPAPAAPARRAAPSKSAESAPIATPLDLAEVARTAFVAPIAEATSEQTARPSTDLSTIPFKPLDEAALRERARATIHEDDDDLEELPLVDPEEDPLMRATRKGQGLLATAAARVRQMVASRPPLPPSAVESPASPEVRKPAGAPPSLSEIPVVRFADEKEAVRLPKVGTKGKLTIAGAVAAILVIATAWAWVPSLIQAVRRMAARAEKTAVPSPPASPATPPPPTLPPDVQAAVDQLPHLTPETIQIVMKKSAYRPRDPAEVFSRAETAAVRGMSALPEKEAEELSALRLAVARSLRPTDRQRVRGYERIRTGRELLSATEDVKVLALFARGVRALPPEKRARLQTLLGKAIVAQLGPLPSPEGTYSAATPGR